MSARLRYASATLLTVDFTDGRSVPVHPIWLRERCQDPRSMDLKTGQRLHDPSDLDLDLRIVALQPTAPGSFQVRFSDGHEARFSEADVLADAQYPPGFSDRPEPLLWDGTLRDFPRAQWHTHPTDSERTAWLEPFLRYGFLILSGVPTAPGTVLKAAAAFGFVRDTNFGALFDVRSVPDASDLAYTSVLLEPHTDNPYRDPVPGVQLLHCLVNETSGGLSTLVDGFAAATALRQRDRDAFEVLSHTSVRFCYRDAGTELTASAAPIDLDITGALRAIHFSSRLDFVPLSDPQQLQRYYRARRRFDQLLRSEEFEIRFLLNQGDLVIFDNCRLLHGRTGFDPAEGLRHLQGCYIDIDAPRSLYRVLRRRASTAPAATASPGI